MLDVHRLELLHAFARLGSITATAAELGYSPSAVSQQLATLEREAGVALIERTARRAILTPAGRELADHAVTVLAAVEAAQSSMRARAGTISGRVDVSCIPSLAAHLAPHLATLQREHPALTVVARETGSTVAGAAVLDGSCDLAVVDDWDGEPTEPASGLAVHTLRRESVLLAVSDRHPRAARSGPVTAAALRQIAEHDTWLCAPAGQRSRVAGDHRLDSHDIRPARRWEFEGLHVQAALVAADAGVALLPATVVADHAERGDLTGLPLQPRMGRTIIALTRTSRHADPALSACLDATRRAMRAVPG